MAESAERSTQDWVRIAALLDDALALPAERRDEWLTGLRDADAALRPTLIELLARANAETDDFMRKPVRLRNVDEPTFAAAHSAMEVGPYRLLREIGSGGMGAVWLAERADGAMRRRVALKLPRMSWDTPGLAARMARERDILAGLEHPNIARLYDAGIDAQGRPYLAMEYVEGRPLDAYCNVHGVDLRERLQLFLQVARAVAHAHAQLVVHRDLKPSNLLVTADGNVHLLDFGIAKLIEGEPGAESAGETHLTQLAGRPLTPDYAAPEQLRGERITVAADIYSLGVVLYELIAGERPHRAKDDAHDAVPLASTTTKDRKRASQLRGDLDIILAKALKALPTERYATVDAFAADVQRHLDGAPVLARPDTLGYRASRFARRHKLALGVALLALIAIVGGAAPLAAVIIALAAGVGAALWQAGIARKAAGRAAEEARQAQRERDRAISLMQRHEATLEFMQVMLTEAAGADENVTLNELLSRSEQLAANALVGQSEQQASVLELLASFYISSANFAKAESVLHKATELARGSPDMTLRARIECNHALALSEMGNVEIARQTIESWLDCEELDAQVAALCEQYLAQIARNSYDAKGALKHALGAQARLLASPHRAPVIEASVAGDIAYAYQLNGRAADADRQFALAIKMHRDLAREESPTAVAIMNNWGIALSSSGNPRRALALYEDVLRITTKRAPNGIAPPYALNNYAHTLILLADYDNAWTQCDLARRVADDAGATLFSLNSRVLQAYVARERGDLDDAARILDELAPEVETLPEGTFVVVGYRQGLANVALRRGRYQEAAAAIEPVIDMLDGKGTRVGTLATALRMRGEARWRLGEREAALSDARRGLDVALELRGDNPHSSFAGQCALLLFEILRDTGADPESRAMLDLAITHLRGAFGDDHPITQRALAFAGRSFARAT